MFPLHFSLISSFPRFPILPTTNESLIHNCIARIGPSRR